MRPPVRCASSSVHRRRHAGERAHRQQPRERHVEIIGLSARRARHRRAAAPDAVAHRAPWLQRHPADDLQAHASAASPCRARRQRLSPSRFPRAENAVIGCDRRAPSAPRDTSSAAGASQRASRRPKASPTSALRSAARKSATLDDNDAALRRGRCESCKALGQRLDARAARAPQAVKLRVAAEGAIMGRRPCAGRARRSRSMARRPTSQSAGHRQLSALAARTIERMLVQPDLHFRAQAAQKPASVGSAAARFAPTPRAGSIASSSASAGPASTKPPLGERMQRIPASASKTPCKIRRECRERWQAEVSAGRDGPGARS